MEFVDVLENPEENAEDEVAEDGEGEEEAEEQKNPFFNKIENQGICSKSYSEVKSFRGLRLI